MANPPTYFWYLVLPVATYLWSVSPTQAEGSSNQIQQLTELIKQIHAPALSSPDREKIAQDLAEAVRVTNVSFVDDKMIDSIVSLLQDHDDIIRFNAARSLRYVGPKAKRAIPPLEAALNRIRLELASTKFWTGTSSEDEICPALQQITGKEVGPGCDFSYPSDDK